MGKTEITSPEPEAWEGTQDTGQADSRTANSETPLALLARLTNASAPAPTAGRTAGRGLKIWSLPALLLLMAFLTVQWLRPVPAPAVHLTTPATYTFAGSAPHLPWPDEGQAVVEIEGVGTLGSHGDQHPVPIASVTKVMTAYVILRDHPLAPGTDGPLITADQKAQDDFAKGSKEHESVVKVTRGQKISEKEALQDLLIPSANNIARLLGRWDAGTESAFAQKMQAAAGSLGMGRTTYTDPSGLDSTTVSTAADQVKLGKAAMDNRVFRDIVNSARYRPAGASHDVYNTNTTLHTAGIIGIKTGSTTAAGGALLFAAEKELGNRTQVIIGAVLDQHGRQILAKALDASQRLVTAASDTLTSVTLLKEGQTVGAVSEAGGHTVPVVAAVDVTAVGWPGLTVRIQASADRSPLPRTSKAGDGVTRLTIGSGDEANGTPIVLKASLKQPGLMWRLTRIT